jgi:hypothetical protein
MPSPAARPTMVLALRGRSAATSTPSIRKATAFTSSLLSGVENRLPAQPPAIQANGSTSNTGRPDVLPFNPANAATATTGTQSSGLRRKWKMASYTGPNPVLTRWASALLGHRRAATVIDATLNERVRTDRRT